jgi:hypothetical protein
MAFRALWEKEEKSRLHVGEGNTQGVTPQMRSQDSRLLWQLRGHKMGIRPLKIIRKR